MSHEVCRDNFTDNRSSEKVPGCAALIQSAHEFEDQNSQVVSLELRRNDMVRIGTSLNAFCFNRSLWLNFPIKFSLCEINKEIYFHHLFS